jgi:hypothetical protein
VNAWEWEAGPASGLSDDRRSARRRAARVLRSGAAASAVLQQVLVVPGRPMPGGNYLPVAETRVEGHMDGTRIRWRRGAGTAGSGRRDVA